MKTKSNAGFSLVELMVVVAIIGVLATIAVPNYLKFQNKAKQASAKSELSGIYTAEKAFFIEYSSYHNNLPMVGYVPEGVTQCTGALTLGISRIYNVGFSDTAAGLPNNAANPCAAASGNGITRYSRNIGGAAAATAGDLTPVAAAGTASYTGFTANATGTLNGVDTWTMTENRVLANTVPGI